MKVIKNIHLTRWFFALFSGVIILYIVAYSVPAMEFIANVVLASLICLTAIDALLVFTSVNPIVVTRDVNARLNLGDDNKVVLTVRNTTPQPINFSLIEGYPVEMQDRKTVLKGTLLPEKEKVFEYQYDASQRGKFEFGDVFIIIRSMFFMASRGVTIPLKQDVHVYPSVLQMKKYELLVFQQQKTSSGIKKIRRLGNNSEFEQIKNYVQGDDLKSINSYDESE